MLQLILFFGEVLYLKLLIVYNLNIAHTVLNSSTRSYSFSKMARVQKDNQRKAVRKKNISKI